MCGRKTQWFNWTCSSGMERGQTVSESRMKSKQTRFKTETQNLIIHNLTYFIVQHQTSLRQWILRTRSVGILCAYSSCILYVPPSHSLLSQSVPSSKQYNYQTPKLITFSGLQTIVHGAAKFRTTIWKLQGVNVIIGRGKLSTMWGRGKCFSHVFEISSNKEVETVTLQWKMSQCECRGGVPERSDH